MVRQVVVQVGECDFVFCPDGLSDDDLVDIVELIPVFVPAGETDQSVTAQIIKKYDPLRKKVIQEKD